MADNEAEGQVESSDGGDSGGGGGGGGKKVGMMVIALMVVEALVIGAAAYFTRPPEIVADNFVEATDAEEDRIIEVLVIDDRLPNRKQGIVYLYQTQIMVQVRIKHQEDVEALITENQGQIKTRLSAIWRQAEPRYFDEPMLSTLTRQAEDALSEIFGKDPETEQPIVCGVLIPTLTGYRLSQ